MALILNRKHLFVSGRQICISSTLLMQGQKEACPASFCYLGAVISGISEMASCFAAGEMISW
jgi:hypothetical protein